MDCPVYLGAKDSSEERWEVDKSREGRSSRRTVEEETEQMDLLGHSFYVFKDAKTGDVKVLYLRNDGDLGLIEPQA